MFRNLEQLGSGTDYTVVNLDEDEAFAHAGACGREPLERLAGASMCFTDFLASGITLTIVFLDVCQVESLRQPAGPAARRAGGARRDRHAAVRHHR